MEQVVMEIAASMEGAGGLGQGKLRVTTERLVFERKKMFGGAGDVTTLPLSTIHSAGLSGVMDKKLKVGAGSNEYVFKRAATSSSDGDLKAIAGLLQRSIAGQPLGTPVQAYGDAPLAAASAPAPAASPPATPAPAGAGWLDELERLGKLHGAGVLNDAEFAKAKAKLLGS